jgi:catechol 2,3-dioxygenase-like lactoylglutathione lyase family enzyme
LKVPDAEAYIQWYRDVLGIPMQGPYYPFVWQAPEPGKTPGSTTFSFFKQESDYFGNQPLMLNFRVSDLDALLADLRAKDVRTEPEVQTYPYGKFGWAYDPWGAKIELWEPNDDGFAEVTG